MIIIILPTMTMIILIINTTNNNDNDKVANLLDVFGGLREVLQYDGNVHVDDDEEADDQIGYQEHHGLARTAAVPVGLDVRLFWVAVVFVHEAGQNPVPAGRGGDLEEYDHAPKESLEVEHVVQSFRVFDVHEKGHAEDRVDEHDQE